MADTSKNTQSKKVEFTQAVTYVDGNPVWDLAADHVAYVLMMADNRLFIPVLRQHTDPKDRQGFWKEEASALKRSVSGIKFKGDNLQLGEPNESFFRDFVDNHFEYLYGTSTDDVDAHRKYLDVHSYMKTRIFKEGVQGVAHDEPEDDVVDQESVPIFDIMVGESEREIEIYQTLFSIEKKRMEPLFMVHTLREVKETDYQKYRKATTRQINARKRKLVSLDDYYLLSSIYDGLVQNVGGVVVDGKPCDAGNKTEWTPLVPLTHKLLVLSVIMREVEGKNVS
jgi:hypothetical protein